MTAGDTGFSRFLDNCKAVAKRAKLSPDNFWLHKFRATFATRHLWAGVDLRTVQHWMGHKDLESTMRYLKPNLSQKVREKVEAAWGRSNKEDLDSDGHRFAISLTTSNSSSSSFPTSYFSPLNTSKVHLNR
jgi:hypothetical protein